MLLACFVVYKAQTTLPSVLRLISIGWKKPHLRVLSQRSAHASTSFCVMEFAPARTVRVMYWPELDPYEQRLLSIPQEKR